MSDDLPVGSRGGTSIEHLFPVDGEYEILVDLQRGRAREFLGTGRERKLDLRLDDQRLKLFTIPASRGRRADINTGVRAEAEQGLQGPHAGEGRHAYNCCRHSRKIPCCRKAFCSEQRFDSIQSHFEGVGAISFAGPYNVQGPGETASRDKIFVCHPAAAAEEQACAEKIIANLAHRAYRRPIAADDLPQLLALYKQGAETGGFEAGVRLALQKILVSPDFIFRIELDPADVASGGVRQVSDIELASRLSFFLWSSIPDDELLAVAERGELSDPAVLENQVRRMLADPRSEALVKNFAGQWLFLRNVPADTAGSGGLPGVRREFAPGDGEGNRTAGSKARCARIAASSICLKTDYTFVNQRLAEHYGIKGIYGNEFRRVAVEDPKRQGLLGQASIMAVTSYPNRTAPTIRGKWVLEQLLGTPPPPPPPNVPSLKEDATHTKLTMRQRMEEHGHLSAVRRLPQDYGPDRLCAGELRRARQVARLRRG